MRFQYKTITLDNITSLWCYQGVAKCTLWVQTGNLTKAKAYA